MNKQLKKILIILMLTSLITKIVFELIQYHRTGVFSLAPFLGWAAGTLTALLGILFFLYLRKRKGEDELPLDDERTRASMAKLHAIAFFIVLLLSTFIFSILGFTGVETVSVKTMIFSIMGLWVIMAVATLWVRLKV